MAISFSLGFTDYEVSSLLISCLINVAFDTGLHSFSVCKAAVISLSWESFYVCYFVLLYGYANFYALLDRVSVKMPVDPRPAVVWVEENIEGKNPVILVDSAHLVKTSPQPVNKYKK